VPFTIPEALEDLPAALSLVQKIQANVGSLPPAANRKMADYSTIICACLPDLAALIDTVEAQTKS
jgi:hypothetical protein